MHQDLWLPPVVTFGIILVVVLFAYLGCKALSIIERRGGGNRSDVLNKKQ